MALDCFIATLGLSTNYRIALHAGEDLAMVTEDEARACRQAFMTPNYPLTSARCFGSLIAWVAFFGFAVIVGLLAN